MRKKEKNKEQNNEHYRADLHQKNKIPEVLGAEGAKLSICGEL